MSDTFVWPEPRKRLGPQHQERIATELRKRYDDGSSIRALAEESGRSYGFVHRSLTASGVMFRPRGSGPQAPR